MSPQPVLKEWEFVLDGKVYNDLDPVDFSFKEQRLYRTYVRELAEDPTIQPYQAPGMDRWPAMIAVIKQRVDPEYTLEQALEEYKEEDVLKEKKPRPTRRTAKPAKGTTAT